MSHISGPQPLFSIFKPDNPLIVATSDDQFIFKDTKLSADSAIVFRNNSYGSHSKSITVANQGVLNETKEFWLKVDGPGIILSEQGDSIPNKAWHYSQLEVVGDKLFCGVWSNEIYKLCLGTIEYGKWYHVVWRYKNRLLDGFLDGVHIPGIPVSRVMPTMHGYKLYYFLGHGTGTNMGCGAHFNGSIALFRLWTSALTDLNIRTNFNMNRGQITLVK